MKILITGNLGYIGPVVAGHLRAAMPHSELIGYDSGYFAHLLTGTKVTPETALDRQVYGDVRDIAPEIFDGVDAVVQLAAISNDPMGKRFEATTNDINYLAAARCAELARAHGARAFVFASSCSVYGQAEGAARTETDPINPLTAYARSKMDVEAKLAEMRQNEMAVTCLRFATACGFSPRLRLDLVLNDFVACALTTGKITVLSDGEPWRPLIDVKDMARAIAWAIRRQSDDDAFLSVNVGREDWNYQVKDLAQAVAAAVPGTEVSINTDAPPDNRSYKVDFSKFAALAPDHIPQVSLEDSIARLRDGLREMQFNVGDFRNSDYMRLRVLEGHIDENRLDSDLRWTATRA